MAKRKLFDKLVQYNANDVKDTNDQTQYNETLSDFAKFDKLHPKDMKALIEGIKANAADGWLNTIESKGQEIDDLANPALEEHEKERKARISAIRNASEKKDAPAKPTKVITAPEKPPKPIRANANVVTPPEKPPKPPRRTPVTAKVIPEDRKPDTPGVNPVLEVVGGEKKTRIQTMRDAVRKIKLPNPFKQRSSKVAPAQIEVVAKEQEIKSANKSKNKKFSMSKMGKKIKGEVIDRITGEENRRNVAKYVTPNVKSEPKAPTRSEKIIAKMTEAAKKVSGYASNAVGDMTKKKDKGKGPGL